MSKFVYLDNAATTSTKEEVVEAMYPFFTESFGNPSSVYDFAAKNKKAVSDSRQIIADALHTDVRDIYFTAGGSESDNWALIATAEAYESKGKHIITSKIEHHAILHTCDYLQSRGFEITYIDVDENGILKLDELKKAIRPDTILISVMFANNEIGSIQPIKEIGEIAKEHDILFHTDAVQAFGQIPINVDELHIDMLSASGHKIGASKGTGFLYVRDGVKIQPLIHGGGQEIGMRSGTENVPGIMGLGATVNYHMSNFNEIYEKYYTLRRSAEMMLLTEFGDRVKINGADDKDTLPNILSVTFKDKSSSDILTFLESMEIYASAGSACSSGKDKNSHVLEAIGLNDNECKSTIRFSFGLMNNIEEIEKLIKVLRYVIK